MGYINGHYRNGKWVEGHYRNQSKNFEYKLTFNEEPIEEPKNGCLSLFIILMIVLIIYSFLIK